MIRWCWYREQHLDRSSYLGLSKLPCYNDFHYVKKSSLNSFLFRLFFYLRNYCTTKIPKSQKNRKKIAKISPYFIKKKYLISWIIRLKIFYNLFYIRVIIIINHLHLFFIYEEEMLFIERSYTCKSWESTKLSKCCRCSSRCKIL